MNLVLKENVSRARLVGAESQSLQEPNCVKIFQLFVWMFYDDVAFIYCLAWCYGIVIDPLCLPVSSVIHAVM